MIWLVFKKKVKNHYFNLFSQYIFTSYSKEFIIWCLCFTILILSCNQISLNQEWSNYRKFVCLVNDTIKTINETFGIITLIASMAYFFRTKSSFNFFSLESFGVSSFKILKPILLFLFIFSLFKIFILHPIGIKYHNLYEEIKNNEIDKTILKKGDNISLLDGKNTISYKIISGFFDKQDEKGFYFTDITILEYLNDEIISITSSKNAMLNSNKEIILNNLSIIDLNNKNEKNRTIFKKYLKLNSDYDIKKLILNVKNNKKIEKTKILHLYDHIKTIKNNNQTSLTSKAIVDARIYILGEFIFILSMFFACLIAFLFCVSSSRNINTIKTSLSCFFIFFAFERIFVSLKEFIGNSILISIFIIFACFFTQLLILFLIFEKEIGYKNIKIIKK